MTRHVAFLRAINVGGHTVKMVDLRRYFESIGFAGVETLIQSGNVIFESSARNTGALELKIEERLQSVLGYPVVTFVRSISELVEIEQHRPFPEAEFDQGAILYIAFLRAEPSRKSQQELMSIKSEIDDFHIRQREVYWLCRKQKGKSPVFGAVIERILGTAATLRNATTIRKLTVGYSLRSD